MGLYAEDEDREDLERKVRQEFSDYRELAGGKNYRYHHLISVRDCAMKIAQKIEREVDLEVLETAALLHDIGRSKDIEDGYLDPMETKEGHPERGAEIIDEYVPETLSSDQVEHVREIVRNHHSEPESVEGRIVQDADKLFKFGVHDLWRMFHYACEKEREMEPTFDYFYEEYLDDAEGYFEKFHFEVSESAAHRRLENLKEAVSKMETELKGEDI